MKNKATVFLLLFLLSACAPSYSTFYTYHLISGRQGQACSNQCTASQQNCRQMAEQAVRQCETQATLNYRLCEASKVYAYDSYKNLVCVKNCYCSQGYCGSADYDACTENFKDCHLNCGGEVTVTTRCTANCQKAMPPNVQRIKKINSGAIVEVSAKVPRNSSKSTTTKRPSDEGTAESELERINEQMKEKTK